MGLGWHEVWPPCAGTALSPRVRPPWWYCRWLVLIWPFIFHPASASAKVEEVVTGNIHWGVYRSPWGGQQKEGARKNGMAWAWGVWEPWSVKCHCKQDGEVKGRQLKAIRSILGVRKCSDHRAVDGKVDACCKVEPDLEFFVKEGLSFDALGLSEPMQVDLIWFDQFLKFPRGLQKHIPWARASLVMSRQLACVRKEKADEVISRDVGVQHTRLSRWLSHSSRMLRSCLRLETESWDSAAVSHDAGPQLFTRVAHIMSHCLMQFASVWWRPPLMQGHWRNGWKRKLLGLWLVLLNALKCAAHFWLECLGSRARIQPCSRSRTQSTGNRAELLSLQCCLGDAFIRQKTHIQLRHRSRLLTAVHQACHQSTYA